MGGNAQHNDSHGGTQIHGAVTAFQIVHINGNGEATKGRRGSFEGGNLRLTGLKLQDGCPKRGSEV